MNKLLNVLLDDVRKQKKMCLFLFIILIMGLIFGSVFVGVLDEHDKGVVANHIFSFFEHIKKGTIDYGLALKNSLSSNLLFVLIIWLLGISVIGIPIIIFILFIKGFIVGFVVSAMIINYNFLGVFAAFSYIFPHIIITSLTLLVLCCYSLQLSFNLFWSVIQRRTINFKNIINNYFFVLLLCIIIMFLASLLEVYVSPYIIRFFLLFVK